MSGNCYLWINLAIPFLTKEWIISGETCFPRSHLMTRKYPTVTGVLRWLWEGLGSQKKKIIRKLIWCKQQKGKTSKNKVTVSGELSLFFLYFSELWKQYIIILFPYFLYNKYVLFFYVNIYFVKRAIGD